MDICQAFSDQTVKVFSGERRRSLSYIFKVKLQNHP